MTQMTQSFKASRVLAPCFLGHLGQLKNNDPNDPTACMAMQFKSMTQMTQMTQSHADILTWCMRRQPATCCAMAGDRWPVRRLAAGNTHNARRGTRRAGGKGPAKTYGLRTIFIF
jgi:hypothetical protein